jgi:hypothetical protein
MPKPHKHLEITVPVPWSSEPMRFTVLTRLGLLASIVLLGAAFAGWLLMRGS